MNPTTEEPKVIVVLEGASLEIRTGTKLKGVLNSDEHGSILSRLGKNIADYRPDIVHQCLLTLLDSPLNKAGRLRVYVHTTNNVLIEIHPQTRIPRTFARFSGLMAQLLENLCIRSDTGTKLLNIVKNPIVKHLPPGCEKIGLSAQGTKVKLSDHVRSLNGPTVFFVGAMSHGADTFPFAEQSISISSYNLSASVACSKICCAFEDLWEIQ